MTQRWLTLLALLALTAPAGAQEAAAEEAVVLTSGEAVTGSLPHAGHAYRTYVVEVPVGAGGLELTLEATGDADVFLKAGGPIVADWRREATARGDGPDGAERIQLTTTGDPPLRAGVYYVDVVHAGDREGAPLAYSLLVRISPPVDGAPGAVPLTEAEVDAGDLAGAFADDHDLQVDLPADAVNYATLRMDVGPDVQAVTLEVEGDRDVDLYARYGARMDDWRDADHRASSPEPREQLVLRRDGDPPLRTGVYYVDVARAGEEGATASVLARYERDASRPVPAPAGDRDRGRAGLGPADEENVLGVVRGDASFDVVLPEGGRDYRTYAIEVPAGARSLLVSARGAERDVDLYLRHGAPIANYRTDPDHSANGSRRNEQLYVDQGSAPPLRPGRYYLDVTRALSGRAAGTVAVEVRFDAARPAPLPAAEGPVEDLKLGERLPVDLARVGRKTGRYRFDVPAGARRLHVAVLGATRDLDLFLRRGGPITSYQDPEGFDHAAISARLNERLTVDGSSIPPLRPGTYYLDVASLLGEDEQVAYTLVVTLDDPPLLTDADLRLPTSEAPGDLTALERALRATVQIASEAGNGSGTCVSPGGYLLTACHVLDLGDGELQEDELYVSFPTAFDRPPEQLFVAELVAADPDRDLALLRVTRDIFDRPLDGALDLPWLALGDPAALRLGQAFLVAGYPAVGGFETRTSISVTRGIVSGFAADTRGRRTWIKTDARINAGNSGGTALVGDPFGAGPLTFVGVPSREQIEDDDELGYCVPTSEVPPEWIEKLRADGAR